MSQQYCNHCGECLYCDPSHAADEDCTDPPRRYPCAQITYWSTLSDESETEFYNPLMAFYHWRCLCGVGGHGFGMAEDARRDGEAHEREHAR